MPGGNKKRQRKSAKARGKYNPGDEKGQKKRRKQRRKSSSDVAIDKLIKKNNRKLKELGKYDEDSKDPYDRSDGERAIASVLRRLKIRFIPEYYTGKLKGDSCSYRLMDFYLPELKIAVEHLGMWNRNDEEKRRYKHKMAIYRKNNIKCAYIFPNNLNNLTAVLKRRIEEAKSKTTIPPDKPPLEKSGSEGSSSPTHVPDDEPIREPPKPMISGIGLIVIIILVALAIYAISHNTIGAPSTPITVNEAIQICAETCNEEKMGWGKSEELSYIECHCHDGRIYIDYETRKKITWDEIKKRSASWKAKRELQQAEPFTVTIGKGTITVVNSLSEPIKVKVTYNMYSNWYGLNSDAIKVIEVPAQATKTIIDEKYEQNEISYKNSDFKMTLVEYERIE